MSNEKNKCHNGICRMLDMNLYINAMKKGYTGLVSLGRKYIPF